MDKEIAKNELAEKLKSMTQQAEEYKVRSFTYSSQLQVLPKIAAVIVFIVLCLQVHGTVKCEILLWYYLTAQPLIIRNHRQFIYKRMITFSPQNLFIAERNKTKYSIETLETIMSRVEVEMAQRKEFQGFLNVNQFIPDHVYSLSKDLYESLSLIT